MKKNEHNTQQTSEDPFTTIPQESQEIDVTKKGIDHFKKPIAPFIVGIVGLLVTIIIMIVYLSSETSGKKQHVSPTTGVVEMTASGNIKVASEFQTVMISCDKFTYFELPNDGKQFIIDRTTDISLNLMCHFTDSRTREAVGPYTWVYGTTPAKDHHYVVIGVKVSTTYKNCKTKFRFRYE
ncbi:hypothetical protein KC901_00830 [Patescibacteria group bacterium]|nr:hypothetical protein [Patescibacteria group bacterium]